MSQVHVGDAAELAQASAGGLLQPVPEARKWRTVRRFARNKLAVAGLIVIVVLYLTAIFAPLLLRYPYDELHSGARDLPPSSTYWLGTDRNGRDVYSRLIWGGRVSMAAGFASVVIIMTIGVTLGALL